ncbi:MAG: spinster family MFS transporter [Acidobacteriaceae bacterium]
MPTATNSIHNASSKLRVPGAFVALGLLTALNFVNYLDRYVLPGVQPLVQREFHVNDERMGALTFAFFITYMLAAPVTGWLGDHYPRKPLILAGTLLWSVATLFTAMVHTYTGLYIRHAVVGIGEATFCIFAPAVLADFFPDEERNRILSIFYLAIPVGAAMGYIVGGVLGERFGWRAPFYASAVPGLLLAALILFWMKEPVRGSSERLTPTPDRATFAGLLRNRAYWYATLGMAMMVFTMGGISVWLPTFLYRHVGYSLSTASQLLGGVTVVDGIAGTWFGGWLAQRWMRTNDRALYLLSAWSMLLALPGALIAFFGPHWSVLPGIVLAEFFLFLNTGPLNAAIINSVSAEVRSTAIAIELFTIHALGDAPSPRIIGAVSDHSNLQIGLAVTLATMLISATLLFRGARFAPKLHRADG